MSRPLPVFVCRDCGLLHGEHPERAVCHTVSKGVCGVCGATALIAPECDYGWLREGWREAEAERA